MDIKALAIRAGTGLTLTICFTVLGVTHVLTSEAVLAGITSAIAGIGLSGGIIAASLPNQPKPPP
jgi:Trk-type K+ transport system membrane component